MAVAVWLEGLDFNETMFDTEKLSVIRGASRALECMPEVATQHLERAFPGQVTRAALGGSLAGFIIDAASDAVEGQVAVLRDQMSRSPKRQDPEKVEEAVKRINGPDGNSQDLLDHAPFPHLVIRAGLAEFADINDSAAVSQALDAARGQVRAQQLREPGLRLAPGPGLDTPCELDGKRAAEVEIYGPPRNPAEEAVTYGVYKVSRASGTRWHFGRAQRQRIYAAATQALATGNPNHKLAFVDDFQEMVQNPPNMLGNDDAMPVALQSKIAVFCADGDAFTKVRQAVIASLPGAEGHARFSDAVDGEVRRLITTLVVELSLAVRNGGADLQSALCVTVGENPAHRYLRTEYWGLADGNRLLRFETLVYGGEDLIFVVPAWLGWWLARRFFDISNQFSVEDGNGKRHPLQFSAGLVFASEKTPIRALKNLAHDLCTLAKGQGGLEIEVLESSEPPANGWASLRRKLMGDRLACFGPGLAKTISRLTIPRDQVASHFDTLSDWLADGTEGEKPPPSQLYRALNAARGKISAETPITSESVADTALAALEFGAKRSQSIKGLIPELADILPGAKHALLGSARLEALGLLHLLQQRDYVRASAPLIEALDAYREPAEELIRASGASNNGAAA
jgi:hypothetical protein